MNLSRIKIQTGSRLHFGLLSVGHSSAREFGGLGMMIDSPGLNVLVAQSETTELDGPAWACEKVFKGLLENQHFASPTGWRIEIQGELCPHVGLGSGTQLLLALAQAISLLQREKNVPLDELAARVHRGTRSAIGIYGFQRGGFLIEAGKHNAQTLSPLVGRYEVEESWRVVLISPRGAKGLYGPEELRAFSQLEPTPQELTAELCRLAMTEIIPGLIERNFSEFARGIGEYGRRVGEYFAPMQGCCWVHPQMVGLADWLTEQGVIGFGQSSWGPSLFVFCEDQEKAITLTNQVAEAHPDKFATRIARPMNTGAVIDFRPD